MGRAADEHGAVPAVFSSTAEWLLRRTLPRRACSTAALREGGTGTEVRLSDEYRRGRDLGYGLFSNPGRGSQTASVRSLLRLRRPIGQPTCSHTAGDCRQPPCSRTAHRLVASALALPDDGDCASGAVDHGVTHRAEEHPLERTPTACADHHQAGVGRGVDQCELGRGSPRRGSSLSTRGGFRALAAAASAIRVAEARSSRSSTSSIWCPPVQVMTSRAADAVAARAAAKPTAAAASAEPSVPTTTRCSGPIR